MKKLISTVAALAVVVSMGATALAQDFPSPTSDADITATPVSINPDYYEIEVDPVDYKIPDSALEELGDLISDVAGDTEVAAVEICDLHVVNKTTEEDVCWTVDEYNPVTVAFAFDDAQNVIGVIYLSDDYEWTEADFEIVDGQVVVTLGNTWDVVFVVKAVKADEPSKDDGKGSAQTGYDSLVYVVSAVALAAGAVFFFITGKKAAKEVM